MDSSRSNTDEVSVAHAQGVYSLRSCPDLIQVKEKGGDSWQIRCPKLGHHIHFAYCRTENLGRPCPDIILCWQPHFAVAEYLRRELSPEEWCDTFEKPLRPNMLLLLSLDDANGEDAGIVKGSSSIRQLATTISFPSSSVVTTCTAAPPTLISLLTFRVWFVLIPASMLAVKFPPY
jgi:hypothetical protein